jgi:hypothetical protein
LSPYGSSFTLGRPLSRGFSAVHNGCVSKEYRTLFAQAVPVLALALGVELRAIVGHTKERALPLSTPMTRIQGLARRVARHLRLILMLAGVEIRELYVVAGSRSSAIVRPRLAEVRPFNVQRHCRWAPQRVHAFLGRR